MRSSPHQPEAPASDSANFMTHSLDVGESEWDEENGRGHALADEATSESRPTDGRNLNNLAAFYHDYGDLLRGEPLYREAMVVSAETLGHQHPIHARILNNLGELYHERGDFQRAEPLYREALDIRKVTVGADHPECKKILSSLAQLHHDEGELRRAQLLRFETET